MVWAPFFFIVLRRERTAVKCEGPESPRGLVAAFRFWQLDLLRKSGSKAALRRAQGKPHSKFAPDGAALVAIIPVAMVFPIFVTQMRLALVGLVPFVRPMARVAAIGAKALDGFTITPFGIGDAAIAVVPIVGFCGGRAGGEEEAEGRSGQSRLSEKRTEIKRDRFHKIASRSLARAGDRGCILRIQTPV